MPHVEIKCYAGRTDEQKKACADKIADAIVETMGCTIDSVSVTIKEVDKEDWKAQVWDASIVPDEEFMYKKPGYEM